MPRLGAWKMAAAVFVLCVATAIAASAQTFTTLLDFNESNGAFPEGALVQGVDGSFYGVSLADTVFTINRSGTLNTLHTFNGRDGDDPRAGLVLGTDGNFYGTTIIGGAHNFGTIFRITPSGILTTLYNFGEPGGIAPFGALVQVAGFLYGTTEEGGTGSCKHNVYCGTVFRIDRAGSLTTLHNFTGYPDDGASPYSALVQASDGNLYGTTSSGGINGRGTVFKITPTGTLTILHNFSLKDGQGPEGTLVEGSDGYLYGTTVGGGTDNQGTIFKISLRGRLTILHSFDITDGALPYAGVIEGVDGNFYGAAANGGDNSCHGASGGGCGTLFSITPTGTFTLLHTMEFSDGANSLGGVFQSTSGILYGMALSGGLTTCGPPYGCGTIFTLDMGMNPFVTFVHAAGKIGQTSEILGQGFTGTTSVSLNGIPASFTVESDTFLEATVPPGATTGYVTVTTPSGTLTSNVPFHVIP